MAHTILITGGSRSGKSRRARELLEVLPEPRVFVATCPHGDEEMEARILRHQHERRDAEWRTVEEPLDLAGVLRTAAGQALLVDCLTLWVSNLMFTAHQDGRAFAEDDMAEASHEVMAAARERSGVVALVSNEVGMGIVPESSVGRRFRDLAGRCNQIVAAQAAEVTLMVSGLPLRVKG